MDEARSLTYSINVEANTSAAESSIRNVTSSLGSLQGSGGRITVDADTSGAESSLRNVTSNLGNVQTQASSVGSAFRTSFLGAVDSGNSLSSSLKAGVGGAFSYVTDQAKSFAGNIASGAANIRNSFAHPIETIKGGLGGAIQSAKDKFVDLVRGADQAADGVDGVGDAAGDARNDVSGLGDAAEESGGKFEKLGGVLKGVGTAIAAVSAAAAAGAVALGKEVVSSFADYEQLVGGVDTLFGDASKTVQNYAANAFQTSGMSANNYMELVTSFSSSLIKSLGGDTAAAASAADQAITDMADNSNKMGTSLESIQNAYRGFSMQNYTMLDNLKLGYGGTQDEMERLLADAEKLSGVKYDISSFADITEAIHVIQTEMGITGTTAKEAAETISGSWASTQSALQNLITGLGRSDADLGMLVGNVVENFGNVVDNVVPVIENMVNSMPAVMDALIPAVGEMLPKLLGVVETLFGQVLNVLVGLLPELIPVAVGAITTIAGTLIDNIPLLFDAGMELVGGLFNAILENLPMLAEAAVTIISTLAAGLGEALPTLIPAVIEGLMVVVTTLLENMPLLLDAGMQLLSGLAEGILTAIPILIEQLPLVIEGILTFFSENLPTILEQGAQIIMTLATGILEALPSLLAQLPSIITGIVGFITENLPLIVETGVNLIVQLAMGIVQAIPQLVAQLPQIISAVVNGLAQLPGLVLDIGKNIVTGLWNGISSMASWVLDKISGFASSILSGIKGFFGIKSPSTVFRDEVGKNMALGVGEGFTSEMGKVEKDIENSIPTKFDLPSVNAPDMPSDLTYGVNPVVGDIDPAALNGQVSQVIMVHPDLLRYLSGGAGITDVAGPDTSDTGDVPERGRPRPPEDDGDPDDTGGGPLPAFSPTITVNVYGDVSDETVGNMRETLRDTVRELYDEFREEELEQMSLKNQYSF